MKGIIFIIVCVAIMVLATISLTKALQKIVQQEVAVQKDETPGFYLFVFDHEKEVWNRATKADLKLAKCEDLRIFPAHAMMKALEVQ